MEKFNFAETLSGFIVYGNTKEIGPELKKMGGEPKQSDIFGPVWVFPKNRKEDIFSRIMRIALPF